MSTRGTVGAVLFVVAGILIATPTDAQAVGGLNTVTVSPSHGRAAAQFQVSYAISPCQQAAGLTIGFSWNGLTPAGQVLGTAATDSTCRATLTTKPPLSAATPGSYPVFGHVALPTGAPAPNTEASTTYTVDITPAPTTTASSSATASSPPSASAPANTAAPSVSATVGNDQPGTAGMVTSGAGKGTVLKFSRAPDWWTQSWPAVVGTSILALGILTATGFPLLLMLRRRRARPASGPSKDKAA